MRSLVVVVSTFLALPFARPVNLPVQSDAQYAEHTPHWASGCRRGLGLLGLPTIPNFAFHGASGAVVIHFRSSHSWTGVFHSSQSVESEGPVSHVDGPCLIVLQEAGPGRVTMSITDLRLEMSDHPGVAINRSITLRGIWRLRRATAGAQVRPGHDTTLLTVLLAHGQTANIELERADR